MFLGSRGLRKLHGFIHHYGLPSASHSFVKLKLNGCKQHSSGKLKFSSSQTNACFALASQPTLSYRVGVCASGTRTLG